MKGIGHKTAKKIVERFGEDSFQIIEEQPERLAEIRGITLEKAQKINALFQEQHELRKAMLFLQDFGVTPAYATKIYKRYKDKTFDMALKWRIKWHRRQVFHLIALIEFVQV